ncbi:TPA: hypothetical protein ACX6RM_001333 [Photobacterium damselae]
MDNVIILVFGLFLPLYISYQIVSAVRKRKLYLTPLIVEFLHRDDVPDQMRELAFDAYMDSLNIKLPYRMVKSTFVIAQLNDEQRANIVAQAKSSMEPSDVSPVIREKLAEIVTVSVNINVKLYRILYIANVAMRLLAYGCKKKPLDSIKKYDHDPLRYAATHEKLPA